MVSGSYPGDIYLFRGLQEGTYARGAVLKDSQGEPMRWDPASHVAVADWDRDGDLDLVIGFIQGNVGFIPSEGGSLRFGPKQDLLAGGEPIRASDGGPCVADWDGDGIEDLILGDGEGRVTFYKAGLEGSRRTLAAGVELVGPADDEGVAWKDKAAGLLDEHRSGLRAKPCVADWNGDGKPDLLVGDFLTLAPPTRTLTPQEEERLSRVEARLQAIEDIKAKFDKEILARARREARIEASEDDLEPDQLEAFEEALAYKLAPRHKSWKTMQQLGEEYGRLMDERRRYRPDWESTGFVWVYLRK